VRHFQWMCGSGKNPEAQDDGTMDMSASLMKIASTSDAGASRGTIVEALREG